MTKGTIERAFERAKCRNIEDIRIALPREGNSNVDAHLAGRVIRYDLTRQLPSGLIPFIRSSTEGVLQTLHRATIFIVSSRG
jgi:hypothetical protein